MLRHLSTCLCLALLAVNASAQEPDPPAKELSGMSIIGNDEAPKSLTIVPWKSSELGVEASLDRVLSETDTAVDREVFLRQLSFYEASRGERTYPDSGRRNP